MLQSVFQMPIAETELRQRIVEVGRLVFQKGWIAANDGNISIRLDEKRVLATPTGVCKGMMSPDDLIICDLDGNKLEGRLERTSEIAMHTTVYQLRPDVRAVVHAHPPVSTGFAVTAAAAGGRSTAGTAAEDDGLYDAGHFRLYDLGIRVAVGIHSLLVDFERNQHLAAVAHPADRGLAGPPSSTPLQLAARSRQPAAARRPVRWRWLEQW